MSYAIAAALQGAVYLRLAASVPLGALIGPAIYDAVPPGTAGGTFVTLGPEDVRDRSDKSGAGAEHDFVVSVVTDAEGFATAKAVAAVVSDTLIGAPLVLTRGRLVGLWFVKAAAKRADSGGVRRIDLTFRARVEDN